MKQLSKREKEVLALVSNGLTSAKIAKQLEITARTVDAHRANIMEKYEAASMAHAVRIGIERGEIGIQLHYSVGVSSNGLTAKILD